jgi:hypothetical protein
MTVALATGGTACIDFVEPDLPERGAPAVFQGALRVWDDGRVVVDGLLAPGLDADAVRRILIREAIVAMNRAVEPASIARNGSRSYFSQWTTTPDSVAGVLVLEGPRVETGSPPPSFRWSGITTPQDDTVAVVAGADVMLRLTVAAAETPAPQTRQWLVQMTGAGGTFRFGGDGAPPDSLLVPAYWLPEPADGLIAVTLSYTRSMAIQQPSDYIGVLLLDTRVQWTLRVAP